VNKLHHRMLKCFLLVIYIFMDLISGWKMGHIIVTMCFYKFQVNCLFPVTHIQFKPF